MTPEARALLLVIEYLQERALATNPAAREPGTTAEIALRRLDEAAALVKGDGPVCPRCGRPKA